jgi:phospholipid/cholesterol/gamma-HCH transport system permease protein
MSELKQGYSWCEVETTRNGINAKLNGSWKLINLEKIRSSVVLPNLSTKQTIVLDGSSLEALDTAGAMVLYNLLYATEIDDEKLSFINFQEQHLNICKLVKKRLDKFDYPESKKEFGTIKKFGRATIGAYNNSIAAISFLGRTVNESWRGIVSPKSIRIKELFVQLENALVDAIPIVAMVTFLIGVVIAYLFAIQIEKYGANIFIVDAVAVAMCRELSPIIVAIIVAGRSGLSFYSTTWHNAIK